MLLDLNEEEIDKLFNKLRALKIHKRILEMGYKLVECPMLDIYSGIEEGWYNPVQNIDNCLGGILGEGQVGYYYDTVLESEAIEIFEKFKIDIEEVVKKTDCTGMYIFINNADTKNAIKNNIKVDDSKLDTFHGIMSSLTMSGEYIFSITESGYLLVFYEDYLEMEDLINGILDLMVISRRL